MQMASFLIADDSEAKRMLMHAILRHVKWAGEIFTAKTSEEAMMLIERHPDIGCAFIDFYIPSANGPAIIRALKAKNPAARIALVSSSDERKNIDQATIAGAEAFVCTSWESDRAERALLDLLDNWSA